MSRPRSSRPFPFAALAAWYGPIHVDTAYGPKRSVACAFADLLGVTRETIGRWQRDGMSVANVDRVTAKLAIHPSEVWPVEWWAPIEGVDPDVWHEEPGGRLFGQYAHVPMGRRHMCDRVDGCRHGARARRWAAA